MRFIFLVLALAAMLPTGSAFARDCTVSKPFDVKKQQQLSGALEDRSGAIIPGVTLELLMAGEVVSKVRVDNQGHYDFGIIKPGKYTIRTQSKLFCAPVVRCTSQTCRVSTRVSLTPEVLRSEPVQ